MYIQLFIEFINKYNGYNKFINIRKKKSFEKILKKIIIFILLIIILLLKFYNLNLNKNYLNIQEKLNLIFPKKIKKKIRIGINALGLKNGGRARTTALILNYLYKIKIFNLLLFTYNKKEENEYYIPDIKRIIIKNNTSNNLIKIIIAKKIDILIYQLSNIKEMKDLNKLNHTKIIFYQHSCIFNWIYHEKFKFFNSLYKTYQSLKYIINLIPFENDFLFKKWGIRSILMQNFMTYEYDSITPSDLSSKIIIMLGRANDKYKRFELGIIAMKYIVKEIPECKMKIISGRSKIENLTKLMITLKLKSFINFVGYISKPEIYFKNASLHIFPTICESFGYVLCETKLYGIPNILVGLDYVYSAKGGTIVIYDESPISIAKEAIKILNNENYRKKLGIEARLSMKKINNTLLFQKWIKLILSIYNGDYYYEKLRNQDPKLSLNESLNILERQIKLLKKRIPYFNKMTINDFQNSTRIFNLT